MKNFIKKNIKFISIFFVLFFVSLFFINIQKSSAQCYDDFGYYVDCGSVTNSTCPAGTRWDSWSYTCVNDTINTQLGCPAGTTWDSWSYTCVNNTVNTQLGCPSGTTWDSWSYTCVNNSPSYTCWDGTIVNYNWQCPSTTQQPQFNYPPYNPTPVYTPPITTPVYVPPVTTAPPIYVPPTPPTIQTQQCWDGSIVPINQPCPQQWKPCPDGSTVQVNQPCPQLPSYTCWNGTKVYNPAYCPIQYQTCWDGSKIPYDQKCPSQYKTCPDGTVILQIQTCPVYQTCWDGSKVLLGQACPIQYQTCWNGIKIPFNQVCPAQYQTCWNGSQIPINQTCPSQYKNCPNGQVVLTTQNCPIQTQTCWDGSQIPVNQVCPVRTQTCPGGQIIPVSQVCPTLTQTCPGGQIIPVSQVCPVQTQQCWDGSIVPITQSCPVKTTTSIIIKEVEIREHSVITDLATKITQTSAQCNGVGLISSGVNSVGWFEFGETLDVNNTTNSASIGNSTHVIFSNVINNLKPNTTYYCRAVMNNPDGTYKGKIVSFKTLAITQNKITYTSPKTEPTTKPTTKTEFVCADGSIATARTVLVGETINAGGKLLDVNIERSVKDFIQGAILNYRITITNNSDTAVSGIEAKIVLPSEMSFVDATTTGGISINDNIMTIPIGNINSKEVKTFILPIKIANDAVIGKNIVTTVYASYNLPVTGAQIVKDEVSTYMIGNIVSANGSVDSVSDTNSISSVLFPTTLLGWLVLFAVLLIIVILVVNIVKWFKDKKKEKEEHTIHHHIA